MRYTVIDAPSAGGLALLVNQAIADGWRPQGGVSVAVPPGDGGSGPHYYQAMVRGGGPDPLAAAVAEAAEEMGGVPAAPPDAN